MSIGTIQDPTAYVTRQLDAAWNRHDLEEAVSYYADDAVVVLEPAPPGVPGLFTGKDEVRDFIQMLLPGFQVESDNVRAEGDMLTWDSRIVSDAFRAMGVYQVETTTQAVIKDGKIARFTPTFSEATLAKMQQAAVAAATSAG